MSIILKKGARAAIASETRSISHSFKPLMNFWRFGKLNDFMNLGHFNFLVELKVGVLANAVAVGERERDAYLDITTFHTFHKTFSIISYRRVHILYI